MPTVSAAAASRRISASAPDDDHLRLRVGPADVREAVHLAGKFLGVSVVAPWNSGCVRVTTEYDAEHDRSSCSTAATNRSTSSPRRQREAESGDNHVRYQRRHKDGLPCHTGSARTEYGVHPTLYMGCVLFRYRVNQLPQQGEKPCLTAAAFSGLSAVNASADGRGAAGADGARHGPAGAAAVLSLRQRPCAAALRQTGARILEKQLGRPVKVLFADDLAKVLRNQTKDIDVIIGKQSVVRFDAKINQLDGPPRDDAHRPGRQDDGHRPDRRAARRPGEEAGGFERLHGAVRPARLRREVQGGGRGARRRPASSCRPRSRPGPVAATRWSRCWRIPRSRRRP